MTRDISPALPRISPLPWLHFSSSSLLLPQLHFLSLAQSSQFSLAFSLNLDPLFSFTSYLTVLLPAHTFTTSLDSAAILSTSDLESVYALASYPVPKITSKQEEVLRGWDG